VAAPAVCVQGTAAPLRLGAPAPARTLPVPGGAVGVPIFTGPTCGGGDVEREVSVVVRLVPPRAAPRPARTPPAPPRPMGSARERSACICPHFAWAAALVTRALARAPAGG
jgi:hypothetical protein